MGMDPQILQLIQEIENAFDDVSREDGLTLHEANAIDDWKTIPEQHFARKLDCETRWQDVPEQAIVSYGSALSFLDAKGFRYYLPAFMIFALRNWDNQYGRVADSCVFHLLHEKQKSLRQSNPGSIAEMYGFTQAQSRAIAHFLRFVAGPDDEFTVEERPTIEAVARWEHYVANQSSCAGNQQMPGADSP